jgi:hypothetical protein
MPLYALKCDGCGAAYETFAHASERSGLRSPCCGAGVETDWSKGAPAVQREWHGRERVSLGVALDPSNIAEIRANCPSVELHPVTGQLISRTDAQNRRQLKELDAWANRLEQEERAAREPEIRAQEAATREATKKATEVCDEFIRARKQRQHAA